MAYTKGESSCKINI